MPQIAAATARCQLANRTCPTSLSKTILQIVIPTLPAMEAPLHTTPLLNAINGLPGPNVLQDHPPFLRACHSPWRFIPQHILVILRGTVLAYLFAVGLMICHFKIFDETTDHSKWALFFHFGMMSFGFTLFYHLTTFSWTYTHLYHPNANETEGVVERGIIRAMSLPKNMGSLRKQFYFTLFHTITCVSGFISWAVYWLITRQYIVVAGSAADESVPNGLLGTPFSDLFGEGWFPVFVISNLYGAPSITMIIETMFFNSIKRPFAVGRHVFGLMAFNVLYLLWGQIGKAVSGCYPYFWMDASKVGSLEAVTAYSIGFVLLAPIMFVVMQGFVAARERLTRNNSPARTIVRQVLDR
ncbi:hypothetical protein VHEMI08356 [[Torrubiella] hemipterigena]|uniref:Uncharacterized protein n=1 Tax=[Torrubiella] hemipterigena TaxID=1531966 RepID=A0A0A1TND5_9HYPO|nr:hypothetical protein VHEMI08356 [[Torrubiella] hemipterigena]